MVEERGKLPVTGPQLSAGEPAAELGSGVYVDVENLRDQAQEIVKSLIEPWAWQDVAPCPAELYLYVPADQAALWTMWAESQFPHIAISVKGIQHFSASSKNSADIAMAADAIADILLGRISHVVVVSDDSDFISLYSKIRDESEQIGYPARKVPFLWVLTDRPDTRSTTIKTYFPNSHIRVVPFHKEGNSLPETASSLSNSGKDLEEMAVALIAGIDEGEFKSSDCQRIIKSRWANHQLAQISGSAFGTQFKENLWPILKEKGCSGPANNGSPLRYEMTQEAKNSIR